MNYLSLFLSTAAILMFSSQSVAVSVGTWSTVSPMLTPRQEMPGVLLDGKIYVAGGMDAPKCCNVLDNFEVYDIATDKWSALKNVPHKVNHPGIAALGGKIYLISGWGDGREPVPTDKCFVYDPASDTWSPTKSIPVKSAAPGVIVYDNRIWCFGGTEVTGFDILGHTNVQVYDPVTDKWEIVNDKMPHGRLHIGAGIVNGKVYLSPGRRGTHTKMEDIMCQEFDLAKANQSAKAWRVMNPLPNNPRTGYIANWPVVNGWLYYISGEPMNNSVHRFRPTPEGGEWQKVDDIPVAVHGIGPVAVGNKIYICGGGLGRGVAQKTDIVQVYTINE